MRVLALCLLAGLAASCSRHVVIERDVGRIDGARSIASSSEERWTVREEPAAPPALESESAAPPLAPPAPGRN